MGAGGLDPVPRSGLDPVPRSGRDPVPRSGLDTVPRSKTLRIVPICRRDDCIRCSVRSLVMPHSATSSASGDEISTTVSLNSGVKISHTCMRRYTL